MKDDIINLLSGQCKFEPTIIPDIITQCLPVAAAACGFTKSDKSQYLYLGVTANRVTGKHLFGDLKGWHTAEELTELINAK